METRCEKKAHETFVKLSLSIACQGRTQREPWFDKIFFENAARLC